MAGLSKKLLFPLFFLFLVLLAVTIAWWGMIRYQWPLWMGVAMGAGVLACFLFILFLKKYLIRRREKKLVDHIVEQGQAINEDAVPELLQIQELEKKWKSNLALLRGSHLRSKENPIYALPWYLAIGSTGTGKTTAIGNSGLSVSFTELQEQDDQLPPTKNCDWWFLDQAIILDTAGRYSVPADGIADQEEWKRFLGLLAKQRKKEPLNGILLFTSADALTEGAADLLQKKGQLLRNRINNIMRTIGYKVPVRLIVTKMDHVRGFTGFANSFIASNRYQQAMGYWNRRATPFWREVLDNVMRETDERLRELRMKQLLDNGGRFGADLLIFPLMFKELRHGLENFLEPLFAENRFQETPYLAGVYFGSGQCCTARPSPNSPDMEINHQARRGTQSFFLKDLFSRIIADGREELEPIREFVLWRRITHNLGLMSWGLFCLFCAGLVGLSFLHNRERLARSGKIRPPAQTIVSENSSAAILELEKLRLNIIELENFHHSSRVPDIGFTQANQAEKKLKKQYCIFFESFIQQPMEDSLARVVSKVNRNTSNELFADYASYTVQQIDLLQRYLQDDLQKNDLNFNPVTTSRILNVQDNAAFSEIAAFMSDLQYSYLAWNDNRTGSLSRLKALQSNLEKLLVNKVDDASWLYQDVITQTAPIKISDFWFHKIPNEYKIFSISGAFTEDGRKKINAFLDLASKVATRDTIEELRHNYWNSYETQLFAKWHEFADSFEVGRTSLENEASWREAAIRMTKDSNPYFALIDTMARELGHYAEEAEINLPPWADAVVSFDRVWKLAVTTTKAEEKKLSSIAANIKIVKERFINNSAQKNNNVEKMLSKEGIAPTEFHMAAAWNEYEKALTALEVATPYKEKTFQVISDWFREAVEPGEEISLYAKVYQAVTTLHGLAKERYDSSFTWRLVEGPFDFLSEFGLRESAAVLQEKWLEQVVAQTETVDKDKLLSLLFEEAEGIVWKFVNTAAEPFLQNTVHGYASRDAFGRHLIFQPSFYSFLDNGSAIVINKQDEYRVSMSNRPMEVNRDATEDPYTASVTLQCAEDKIILENDNYPRTQTFSWSPDKCGDVNLTIEFPGVTLYKSYTGNMAFAVFLNSFKDGALLFTPADFPDEEGHLRDSNIKEIVLNYAVTGQEPILRLLHRKPVVPKLILQQEQQSTKKNH
uniref:type VI secretion protein IcmF/TssM N-terminal domain-containing protein n=1 Tax=Candidatus Electrothrix sp. TaxID=2170559 RepID=UPI004055A98E